MSVAQMQGLNRAPSLLAGQPLCRNAALCLCWWCSHVKRGPSEGDSDCNRPTERQNAESDTH